MKATIITIGDEILIGQIVDTNSVSIAKKLNAIGITIAEKLSIGDTREAIVSTLDRALKATDVLVITGGLGPTKDDITKHTLCNYFGSIMRYDEVEAEHIRTCRQENSYYGSVVKLSGSSLSFYNKSGSDGPRATCNVAGTTYRWLALVEVTA